MVVIGKGNKKQTGNNKLEFKRHLQRTTENKIDSNLERTNLEHVFSTDWVRHSDVQAWLEISENPIAGRSTDKSCKSVCETECYYASQRSLLTEFPSFQATC